VVAHVDSSDCWCGCIGKIIARDLRLVASRLYKMGVTRPGTRHVPCRYKQQGAFLVKMEDERINRLGTAAMEWLPLNESH
jgi:hypothetical protein